ncbi:phage tail family protein [Alkalihalobacillus sp. LMS6]|uniref:phage tail family protein n=1 Tax=Alkalihalobacillus sp. LMS6 TaxID=2924034 RepID=UPI0020D18CA1|nr:phage tail family protein [Alkalihalobacillus sp. LMS6]UTR05447.1 phage tail family protein [Alkalihalobacillus sp. LMS6]
MPEVLIENIRTGQVWDCHELGYLTRKFLPQSLQQRQQRQEAVGSANGHIYIPQATSYDGRLIDWDLLIKGVNYQHFLLKRTEFLSLICGKDEFYAYTKYEPNKLWKVTVPNAFQIPNIAHYAGEAQLILESSSSYAYSRGTLDDRFDFSGIWQFGMNIPVMPDEIKYKHQTRRFTIWNLGHAEINPVRMNEDLKIIYQGASNGLRITNETTQTSWQYNGSTSSNDRVVIEDVFSYKNSQTIFPDTNKSVLTLAQGANQITLTGTSGAFEIAFDFPFLFI